MEMRRARNLNVRQGNALAFHRVTGFGRELLYPLSCGASWTAHGVETGYPAGVKWPGTQIRRKRL